MDSTDRSVRHWSPETRGCHDQDEDGDDDRETMTPYSIQDCSNRCRSRLSLDVCDCTPWYLSRVNLRGKDELPICSGAQVGATDVPTCTDVQCATFSDLCKGCLCEQTGGCPSCSPFQLQPGRKIDQGAKSPPEGVQGLQRRVQVSEALQGGQDLHPGEHSRRGGRVSGRGTRTKNKLA